MMDKGDNDPLTYPFLSTFLVQIADVSMTGSLDKIECVHLPGNGGLILKTHHCGCRWPSHEMPQTEVRWQCE